ncbi:MAG: hypothetical protein ABIG63_10465, partial [Chloroflexota bacterium]
WLEIAATIRQAQGRDLNVALRPVPHFPTAVDEWWSSAPRDFPWWVSWFDRYQAFVLHHADLAEQNGVQTLILGGEWMSPALPSGSLSNGDPSGVPPDAEARYRELLAKVREHFSGTVAWALSYPEGVLNPPGFLDEIDQIYVLWSAPLAANADASPADLQTEAERIISADIYGMWLIWKQQSGNESLVISLAYPSVEGILTGCLADPIVECIPPESLKYPAPDYPLLELGLEDQARAYQAVMAAVSQHEWVGGVVSRGYYPPAVLHDKSTSVHGKPAEDVLHAWFEEFR